MRISNRMRGCLGLLVICYAPWASAQDSDVGLAGNTQDGVLPYMGAFGGAFGICADSLYMEPRLN